MSARGTSRRGALAATLAVLAISASPARGRAQLPAGPQVEGRIDAITATTPSLQGGVAVNVPAGLYARLGATLAGGVAWRDGASRGAARADLFARFLLDPFRQSPLGFYGVGGLSAMYDGFESWRPRVLAGIGVESRIRHGRAFGAELALGGGVRLAVFVRSARASGR